MEILLLFFAYLLGSIPTAVWVGKWFYNIDIRNFGSGNAGATNTLRVLGWKAGLPVFIIDGLKGAAAVELIYLMKIWPGLSIYYSFVSGTNVFVSFQLILGFTALIGHIFPIFAGFRGGKGVATLLGVVIAINPLPALLAFVVFVIILLLFKYVSVGSITAGLSYPLMIFFLFPHTQLSLKIASIFMSLALILTHKKNIRRLIKGEESKALFLFKSKKEK